MLLRENEQGKAEEGVSTPDRATPFWFMLQRAAAVAATAKNQRTERRQVHGGRHGPRQVSQPYPASGSGSCINIISDRYY